MVRYLALAVASAAALWGCSSALEPQVASVRPRAPAVGALARPGRPFVRAGTLFSVQANEPIDTYFTAPGTAFTASVVDPLFSASGEVIVPRGARVYGKVMSVGPYDRPRLRISLDEIDTSRGRVPVQAALRHAQRYQWLGPDALQAYTSTSPAAEFTYGPSLKRLLPVPDGFAYQNEWSNSSQQPREVRVPRGALLELALLEPLVLP
jgi:hypothetical protein